MNSLCSPENFDFFSAAPVTFRRLGIQGDLASVCPNALHTNNDSGEVTSMEVFQNVMYGFFAVLMVAAIGIAVWFYKRQKENDR